MNIYLNLLSIDNNLPELEGFTSEELYFLTNDNKFRILGVKRYDSQPGEMVTWIKGRAVSSRIFNYTGNTKKH